MFFHCTFAKHVWLSAPVFPSIEYNESIVLRSLWGDLITRKNLPPTGVTDGQLVPWILWSIWTARNNMVFSGKPQPADETLSKAIAQAREWGSCQATPLPTNHKLKPPGPTPPNCVLIKSDAAWNEAQKIAGLGWTVESQSRVTYYSVPAHHVRSPLVAEALALREALGKCRELGLSRIRCESDSATLIKALKMESSLIGLYGILAYILSLASSFECFSFHWISRIKNVEADKLAK